MGINHTVLHVHDPTANQCTLEFKWLLINGKGFWSNGKGLHRNLHVAL